MMLKPGIKVFFIRHGETDWNAAARMQGATDIPLNDRGRGQAAENGRRLAGLVADLSALAFVASPLVRAQETMQIVRAVVGLPRDGYATDPRLREISFGKREGGSWPDYVAGLMTARDRDGTDPWSYVPPDGESYAAVSSRMGAFFGDLERDAVVVAHGGICRCLLAGLGGDRLEALAGKIPQDRIMLIADGAACWQ